MKNKLTILSAILALSQFAYAEGIRFENISLSEAFNKAAEENKLVFVDCYIPSCGPCKFMADNIFPLDECGDFFNPKFISLKKDLEEDNNKFIADKYNVMVYPTFLILNPDGSIFYKQEGGATKTADKFLEKMAAVMKIGEYNTRFNNGEHNDDFMLDYINALVIADKSNLRRVLDIYIPTLTVEQLASPKIWEIISNNVDVTDSPSFRPVFNKRKQLAEILGKDIVSKKLSESYENEFRLKKRIEIDFFCRAIDVSYLTTDGLMKPSLLNNKMMIRHVINNRDTRMIQLVSKAIKEIDKSDFPEEEKVEALMELNGIGMVANGDNKKQIYKELNNAVKNLSSQNQAKLKSIINSLK